MQLCFMLWRNLSQRACVAASVTSARKSGVHCVRVKCTHKLSEREQSHRPTARHTSRALAVAARQATHELRRDRLAVVRFVTLASETYGRWGPATVAELRRIARLHVETSRAGREPRHTSH